MEIINRNPKDLIEADYNPRKISDKDFKQLKKSLKNFDCVEPIIVNKHPERMDIIVGGHQRLKAMKSLKFKSVPTIEVSLDLEAEKELNVRLNKNTGEFDYNLLEEHFSTDDLIDWGFHEDEFETSLDEGESDDDNPYTMKVTAPVYEPTGEKPELSELYNDDKVTELAGRIKKALVPDDIKSFLYASATRHRIFDYSKIAEFYCHADKETQELMEESALIIIDFEKAIQHGYVKLNEDLAGQYLEEHGYDED